MTDAFEALERGVYAALETYSNVHRGSGHHSLVSTRLFEQAREIVLAHLGLSGKRHAVLFCTPRRAERLESLLTPGSWRAVSSQDIGLPLGVRALAVERRSLPKGAPIEAGGGTARLVAPGWVVWAKAPDRFEAGTPPIVNVIAFAKALQMIRQLGEGAFRQADPVPLTAESILRRDALEPGSGRELLEALRHTLIGRGARVPTAEGDSSFVNLDNGASTRTFEPIWDAARQAWRQPSPIQQEIVRETRAICAAFLGAPLTTHDVIFTSNTTEAINLAADSLGRESSGAGGESLVLNTLLEHNSNELPWRRVPGCRLVRLPVDPEGFVDVRALETVLRTHNAEAVAGRGPVRLVAVSGASNVLGTFNDLAEISRVVHRYGARLLVDAAQLVAHRRVEMEASGIDYLAFSAHKTYAPFGTGVLLAKKGLLRFDAAELERIRASGEENVGGIAALGKALVLLQRIGLDVIEEEERRLTVRALRGLAQVPGLTLHGIQDPDSPRFARKGGVIAFDLKGRLPSRVARELAERGGIGVRYGCHCAHLLIKRLLGVPPWAERLQGLIVRLFPRLELPGVVRVSLGIENTEADVDALIQALQDIARSRWYRAGFRRNSLKQRLKGFALVRSERVYAATSPTREPAAS